KLLGHVLENFTMPFITPNSSLTEQISMLSTCAHLIFVLFREYRTEFMSNQLYGDTQSTIKNIVFSVAKQQLEDPDVDVNANEDGTDPLEGHFAFMRMAGGHNSAMNHKQGVERNGWACDIQGVYSRWPDLHKESRRRRVTRTEQKDHLNSSDWTADLRSGNCDLVDGWALGEIRAIRIFQAYSKLAAKKYDFPQILIDDVDFLRPWGGNYYPGFADDKDRSVLQPTSGPAPPSPSNTSNPAAMDVETETESESEAHTLEGGELETALDPEPITLLDIIDDEPEPLNLAPGAGIRPNNYVADENGELIHKASICRLVLNKEFIAKSKNRTDRAAGLGLGKVRCFTKVESRSLKAGTSGNMTGSAFIPGDIFLTLVRHGKIVSMAVVKSTAILHDGRSVRDIAAGTIANPQANVKLTGQIVHLEAVKTMRDDIMIDVDSNTAAPILEDSWTWIWTGTFLTGTSKMKATGILTTKPVVLTVPGVMVELINPSVVDANGRLSEQGAKGINSSGTTWALHHPSLSILLIKLEGSNLRSLPRVKESINFPYKSASGIVSCGEMALLSEAGTALVADKSTQGCLYCPEIPKNWHAHMGGHILRRLRNSGELQPKRKAQGVSDTIPCGFCGRSGRPECQVFMKPNSKKNEIQTKCQYAVNFQYKTANEGNSKGACRNVPIICGLCPTAQRKNDVVPAVWRYNMAEHLKTQHPEYASPQQPEGLPLPYAIWKSSEITHEEEVSMGVKEFLIPRQFTQVSPA
ncbi:hypothetical protein B0H11DRAFT_1642706, partial [Mycena galericulata]